jgi:hypothetical protein
VRQFDLGSCGAIFLPRGWWLNVAWEIVRQYGLGIVGQFALGMVGQFDLGDYGAIWLGGL